MKKIIYILLLFMAFGCVPATKISVVEAGAPVFYGLQSVHGKAVVESRAGKTLVVESAELVFSYKTRTLATGRLILPIEVPSKAVSKIRYDLAVSTSSLTALTTLVDRMESMPDRVFVDVSAWVRYGNIRRKVEIKDISYSEIITNFVPARQT